MHYDFICPYNCDRCTGKSPVRTGWDQSVIAFHAMIATRFNPGMFRTHGMLVKPHKRGCGCYYSIESGGGVTAAIQLAMYSQRIHWHCHR